MSDDSPVPGDILIARRSGDDLYEISIVPGRPQFTVPKQHEAVTQAHAFAETNGATVWMVSAGAYIRLQPKRRKGN